MYNQWNSANVDQLVLRKGDGCVLYSLSLIHISEPTRP